ncbi:MAG: hypothetical protein K2X48_09495 [Chitinophagaceae bacterium]|nr:hypothetical protein [Chitinophagaceae bacterium]
MKHWVLLLVVSFVFLSGKNQNSVTKLKGYDNDAMESVLLDADTLNTFPFVKERVAKIKEALQQPRPVLLYADSITQQQSLAQIIALSDSVFTQFLFDTATRFPLRNEVFGIYPARESDMAGIKMGYNLANCYRVEMYNYALNNTSVAIVDIAQQLVLNRFYLNQSQPGLSKSLITLATQIAIESPEVQTALGFKPGQKDALMASTKTSLNRTRCERSRHLYVAPTFVKGDKALWAIVDLTDHRLVGVRWTNVGTTGAAAPMITERRLQDDKITSCYCEKEQKLARNGWDMKYMLTSSDGLRITDVLFNGVPVLRSAKLVDWHVSYSGTDGFGYSDAVGCPYFSQAAVVAWEIPKVMDLLDEEKNKIGFVLEQTYRSEGWPTPCNYNYKQRYEFYNDGRFRVSCASLERGGGNTGTYRPVFRIAFAGEQNNFYEYNNATWNAWTTEKWREQNATAAFTPEGYMYKLTTNTGGYFIEPGKGQFKDGGRGDFSFVYVTKHDNKRDEGESDLVTIGPCCNTDYHQGLKNL